MLHTKEKKVSSLKVNVLQNLVSLILEQKFLRRARAPLSMIHNCGIFNFNLNSYWRQRRIRLTAVCIPHVPVISLFKSSKHIWLVFYFCMIIYITESWSIWSYAINTRIYIYLRLLHSFSLIFFYGIPIVFILHYIWQNQITIEPVSINLQLSTNEHMHP